MTRDHVSAIFQKKHTLTSIGILPWETVKLLSGAIDRNPNLSQVALDSKGAVVGFLFCVHDGLRGAFHHLWVDEECRRIGVASALVKRSINDFMAIRPAIKTIRIMVPDTPETGKAVDFWEKVGFSKYPAHRGKNVPMFLDLKIEHSEGQEQDSHQGTSPPPPSSLENAVIQQLWQSKHRNLIVMTAGMLMAGGAVWRFVTSSIPQDSLIGKISNEKKPEVFPAAKDNNSSYFTILSRRDFIDLDTYRDVPERYRTHNVSPTIRETEIELVKKNQNLDYFYNQSKTSGSTHDLVCLSGHIFKVYPVSTPRILGGRTHNDFEMSIDLNNLKTGASTNLHWQTVSWNKFQGEDNWWASVIATYDIEKMDFTIDFPTSAGIGIANIRFKKRVISTGSFETLDTAVQNVQINPQTGEMNWKMTSVEGGYEYAVFWDKKLTVSDD